MPVDTWVTARWPDGTVKWTGHAGLVPASDDLSLVPAEIAAEAEAGTDTARLRCRTDGEALTVDTGALRLTVVPGPAPLRLLEIDGVAVGQDGRIVASSATTPERTAARREHTVRTDSVSLERDGEAQAVIRLDGHHEVSGERVLPFTLRLYATAGSTRLRAVHSLVWDADPERLFLTSLGLRMDVPLRAAHHDRHVRLSGGGGFLTEAVRGLTGLRRDPGADVRSAQVAGRPTPPPETWPATVSQRLRFIPTWNDWTLRQLSADGYTVSKRTAGSARGSPRARAAAARATPIWGTSAAASASACEISGSSCPPSSTSRTPRRMSAP